MKFIKLTYRLPERFDSVLVMLNTDGICLITNNEKGGATITLRAAYDGRFTLRVDQTMDEIRDLINK